MPKKEKHSRAAKKKTIKHKKNMKKPSKKKQAGIVKKNTGKSLPAPKKTKKEKPMAKLLLPLGRIKEIFRTRYGFFLFDGSEFVVNTPETPAPWSNILTNGDYGMMISQSGCGMSFQAGLSNRITRWRQDNISENFGKFIYIRDNQSQDYWSAAWKPVCKNPEFYEVRHGIGYTNISSKNNGIISSLIYYVSPDEPVEVWQMRIKNVTQQVRFLSVFSYLEWDFGAPSGNREYDKFFVDTIYDEALSAVLAKAPNGEYAFHSVNGKVQTFTCGRDFFLGSYRDVSRPRCVEKGMCFNEQGRYNDPAASLHMEIELAPNGEEEFIFTLGKCAQRADAERIIKKYKNIKNVEEEFSRMGHRWTVRFSSLNITTPDEGANILTNKWFRYQSISAGLSASGSVYNPSGRALFKDNIINGLTLLSVHPKYLRQLLLDCAEMQFENGSVVGSWDIRSRKGTRSDSVEAPLWLAYAVCEYIKETNEISFLDEDAKFQDSPKKSIFTHCRIAVERALESSSKRGLFPIYPGDHMDALDSISDSGRCESVWLAQFLIYLLPQFIQLCRAKKERQLASDYEIRHKRLVEKIRKSFFDKDRFIGAVSASGEGIGVSKGKDARLFLDTQTWAVISGLCLSPDDAASIMGTAKDQLYKDHGPVTVSPCYKEYDKESGTISRLPGSLMQNGGVSIESSCWAIWAETLLGNGNNAWNIYTKIDPVDRSHRSDIYKLEPFVSCEYIDGPKARTSGRAENSWYNRGGYWMFKVMVEQILGIRPVPEGLLISPCIPNRWKLFKVKRTFRNAYYTIEVLNPRYMSSGIAEVTVDGKKQKSNIIAAFGDEKRHHVRIVMGKPAAIK
ncbi:MAG: hypothetical protein PHV77_03510 [Candidatus Omnitrophica bacterium]|nr:hypothetical protein [Candidatus Omnitrophota bacterium]